jgi:hypothetical protein
MIFMLNNYQVQHQEKRINEGDKQYEVFKGRNNR